MYWLTLIYWVNQSVAIIIILSFAGSSKGKKESRPSRSGKEGADNDDESPSHKIAPIINKLNENRSKLMTMFAELDKYKCGKVNYCVFPAEYYHGD